jgi:hypothetical protein
MKMVPVFSWHNLGSLPIVISTILCAGVLVASAPGLVDRSGHDVNQTGGTPEIVESGNNKGDIANGQT